MGSQDKVVTKEDLIAAEEEIGKLPPESAAARWRELEPQIVHYIDMSAELMAGRLAAITDNVAEVRRAQQFLRKTVFTVMRARDLGYYRLWEKAFVEYSALSELNESDPENGPKDDPKNA
jgi:hypothetical protein